MITQQTLPLEDLKVIDASSIIAGPMLGMYLADFGADVIKIEHPTMGDSIRSLGFHKEGHSLEWKFISRNKKPITLNLGKPEGQEILKKLIKETDIIIENFRPGTMEKWGLGWEVLSKINPRLVMVRISGFGQNGPYKNRPGFGTLAEAMSGFASINGYPDQGPLLPGFALADQVTALLGAYAVMVAIYHSKHCGKGQFIDLPIYEGLMSILGNNIMNYDQLGIKQKRLGNRMEFTVPRNLYHTKDNKWVAISGSSQTIVERLLRAIGKEELINDPRFINNQARQKNADELDDIISEWVAAKDQQEVLTHLLAYEVAVAPVYDIEDIFQDPHFNERKNIIQIEDRNLGIIKMQNVVPAFSLTPGKIRWSGLEKGEYNITILKNLGYSNEEIEQLKMKGII